MDDVDWPESLALSQQQQQQQQQKQQEQLLSAWHPQLCLHASAQQSEASSSSANSWASMPQSWPSTAAPLPSSGSSHAALHACLAAPSHEQDNLKQQLERSRMQLECMCLASPSDGGKKHAEGLARMQQLVDALAAAAEQRVALERRSRLVSMQVALAEREQLLMQLQRTRSQRKGRGQQGWRDRDLEGQQPEQRQSGAPQPIRPLGPSGGAYPESCGAIVSVHQLPGADWSCGWDDRVRALRVLDLLLLHRQWLQWCALRLPQVQMLSKGAPEGVRASAEVQDLCNRYADFTDHVLRLQPELWYDTLNFDLETLLPLTEPPSPSYMQSSYERAVPGCLQNIKPVRMHYHRLVARLRAEEAKLQRRYAQLTHVLSSDPGRGDRVQVAIEADKVLEQLEANLRQQELHVSNCVHAVFYALPIEQTLKLKVMLYPLAVNGQVLKTIMYSQPAE